ncbi:MAG: D-xylose transport system permease protein [Solirubrobacteraceae bacterium]|nr:D-xylose transport system permease protein [Solirubrobacteraceae bacterium]
MADPAHPSDVSTQPPSSPAVIGDSALTDEELATVAPEILAESLPDYFRAWGRRIRNGESGALPIIVGLILIVIFFQAEQSTFLTAGNLVNLFTQAGTYILFGAAEIWVLLLSEIDLSVGYNAAVGAFVIAELLAPPVSLPWWVAILGGLLATGGLGAVQGTLITRLGLPSFVVTLGGLLGFEGIMLELANIDKTAVGGVIQIDSNSPVYKLVNTNMSSTLSWVALVVVLALFTALRLWDVARRRRHGLTAPPLGITLLTLGLAAAGGFVLVLICNMNRGALTPLRGVPWVIPFVLIILLVYSFFLTRMRTGRYIYAIGGNPEAARRAGIDVAWVRTLGFVLAGVTAGLAGLVYESRQGSMATDIDGGSLVLFGVAAAVIGGTSLFGGRGKMIHALLGGVVIAAVFNGLGLMGIAAAGQDMATAIVLILAVTLDALVRRRGTVH